MDKFNAMSIGEKGILIAGAVLLIASFLPWYRVDLGPFGDISRSGWQSPGALWSMLAVFIGLAMAIAVALKNFTDVELPDKPAGRSWTEIYLGASVIAALSILIKIINENEFMSFGFYLGIICVAALVGASAMLFREEGGVLPGMGGGGSTGGSPPSGSPPASPPPSPPPSAPSGQ